MKPAELANRWLHRNVYGRHGIKGTMTTTHDGIPLAFLVKGEECFTVHGFSWSHLIARIKLLIPELVLRKPGPQPIELADAWLERELHAKRGIFVLISYHDGDGSPIAWLRVRRQTFVVRGYCWTQLINRVKRLLTELNLTVPPHRRRQPPES